MSRYLHGHTPPVVAAHTARTVDNFAGYLVDQLARGLRGRRARR